MSTLNDEKRRALEIQIGATGSINDDEVNYLKTVFIAGTPIGNNREDLWHQFWDEVLIAPGSFNDRAYAWLATKLQTQGSLNERWLGYWKTVVENNLYVNSELAGGALSGPGNVNPPTNHTLGFNQVTTSEPLDQGGGIFHWHSNTLEEQGRQYLAYDLVANNPGLPTGVYEFTYDIERTGGTSQQVFTSPAADNMTFNYIHRNIGADGATVRVGSTLTVTGVIGGGTTGRVGVGISSTSGPSGIISNPRLVKVGA